ncbi:MAG: TonB-dependent receptor [Bryobacteraceae bacterium]|jgi:hypothetical protein
MAIKSQVVRIGILSCLSILTLAAAEYHGVVRFGGLPVPGASITATQGDKKLLALTGEDGTYSYPDLSDGVWTIQVEMLCFTPLKQDVNVGPNMAASEWDLKLLPLDEIKAAAAPAPPPALSVQAPPVPATPQAKGKKKVNPPQPVNTSSAYQRSELNASANPPPAASDNSAPPPGDLNQSATDALAINGSQNNGAASPFSQSQAFGNGRRGAGSLYNGSLGFELGNSALYAQNYSIIGQSPKPSVNNLTGLATLGGPLRIPHLISANSAPFFYIAYQLARNRNSTTQPALVPTLAQREGVVSPQAAYLLNFYPLPNFSGSSVYNYQTPLRNMMDQDSVQSRLSKTIGRSNQVFGTFAYQNTRSQSTSIFAFDDATAIQGIDTTLNWQHRFSQRLFTTVKFEFNRQSTLATPYFAGRENVSGNAGIAGNDQDPLNWGPPTLTFSSGIVSLTDVQESSNRNQTTSISDSTFWNRAPHNITIGGDFRRQQFNQLSQQNARGTFGFTGTDGSDFAAFQQGVPDTIQIAYGNADKYFRDSLYDAFINDDWRVSPGFTLNAGLRWEYSAPMTELQGRLVNLDIAPGFSAYAPVAATDPVGSLTGLRYPDSLVRPDKHAFQPRIGTAWRPISGSSLVVRVNYGVNYNTSVYQSIAQQMAQQSLQSKVLSEPNPGNLTLANAFNPSSAVTQPTFAIDPNFRVGYAQTWSASVQRDLPQSLILTATYLGIKGTRAPQEFLPNTNPSGPCTECGYVYMTSNGNSTRDAGQLQLRRRLHNGVTATLQYTYAKAIDDAALGGKNQGTPVIAQNWLDLSAERGLSNFDQRQLLNAQLQYSTGVGVGGGTLLSGWRGGLFKEWTVATQITAGTGLPLTPLYPIPIPGTAFGGVYRGDFTGAPLYAAPPGLFLNPAAVAEPATGQWGNAGRDSITGPAQFSLNASLARTFRLRDRLNMDLRFDSTNALNHVTFQSWNTTVNGQFGSPTIANAMRQVQLYLRVRF